MEATDTSPLGDSTMPATADREIRGLVVSHVSAVWGAQLRLLDTAPFLADHGVHLTLAAPPGPFVDRWRDAGLDAATLELPDHNGIHIEGRATAKVGTAARELAVIARSIAAIARRARGFDLVQSHSLWAHLEVAAAGRLARRPVVLDLHDIVEPGPGRRVLRAAGALATMTIANSAATAATIGGVGTRVRVVHPGVDPRRFHPGEPDPLVRAMLSAHPHRPLVGILGRVDPNKGVGTLVEAMARLGAREDGPCLAIVGREHVAAASFRQELRRRAEDLLGDRVRFVPPQHDAASVLRACDVLVNASRHEPFGRTVLEAQACGTPVVATAAGGIPEFVVDGTTGLLVPPFEVDALAAAIERLLRDDDLRRRLVGTAVERAGRLTVEHQSALAAAAYHAAAS